MTRPTAVIAASILLATSAACGGRPAEVVPPVGKARTHFLVCEANEASFETNPETFARPSYDAIEVPGMR